jgi:hypothetical protein
MKNCLYKSLFSLSLVLAASGASAASLEDDFRNPPDSAKPLAWWHWMDGNVTKEGITADLESMKRIGLGGTYMFNVGMGMPFGSARFMGPEWLALMDHSMKESSRLGLQFGIHNCDGWGQSGGPWITPETSMKQLTWTVKEVEGPVHFDEKLAQPEVNEGFYRDIAVVAFPVPNGSSLSGRGTDTVVRGSLKQEELDKLVDGNAKTVAELPGGKRGSTIDFVFSSPRTVRSVVCRNTNPNSEAGSPVTMEVSEDGKVFRTVGAFTPNWVFKHSFKDGDAITAACEEATGTVFRLTFKNSRPTTIGEIELSETVRVHFGEAKATLVRAQGHGADRSRYDEFPGPDRGRALSPKLTLGRDAVKVISGKMSPNGHLQWEVPSGKWRIMRIGFTSNGRMIAPASPEGKGLDCDKLDAKTVRFHLEQYVGKLKKRADSKSLVAMEIDSWECGIQNWTAGFEQRFRERNGYDLLQFMPTMLEGWVVENADVSERVLWDWRRFLSDQFSENYFSVLQAFAKEKGLTYVGEATGRMQFLYDVAALRHTDVPMGEFWNTAGKGDVRVDNKAAASIAHTTGKSVVASEAYTSGGESAAWDNHPFSLKALGDRAFCAGVNQYVFHTFAHQPHEVIGPGFTFGQWGLNFNRGNTWWEPARAWMEYLTRCNAMLRAGTPSADVLFYVGDDVPNYIGWRDELHPALPAGYDFDGCDARSLMDARVENGKIILPSGTNYRVLLLPNLPTMRPAVLKKVQELVAAGAVVLGPRPAQSPCLQDVGAGDQALRKMAEELWGGANPRVFSGITFEELFQRIGLKPDFDITAEADVLYIHRQAGDADIYFVSNQKNRSEDFNATFRVGNRAPELWDPATGEIRILPDFRVDAGVVRVPLHLDPCGSAFIVFRGDRKPVAGRNWTEFKNAQTLTGPWQVSFPPKLGAPASAIFSELGSWTKHSDAGVRFFSGTATYTKEFELPANIPDADRELSLDLGQVSVIAEVELNGENLGILWKPPFRVRVDGVAKAGTNHLVVKVTNLWRNRLIGDAALPDNDIEWKGKSTFFFPAKWPDWLLQGQPRPSGRIAFCSRKDVYTADDPLLESGLLGPVILQTAAATTPSK